QPDGHPRVPARSIESLNVFSHLEGSMIEGPRRIVDGIAPAHAAIKDGNNRLAFGHEATVDVDNPLTHRPLSLGSSSAGSLQRARRELLLACVMLPLFGAHDPPSSTSCRVSPTSQANRPDALITPCLEPRISISQGVGWWNQTWARVVMRPLYQPP